MNSNILQEYALSKGFSPDEFITDYFTSSEDEQLDMMNHIMQQGGQVEPQGQDANAQIMQVIQMYAQISGQDPQQLIEQLQQLQPEEQQAAIAQMVQAIQGSQGQDEQEQIDNPQEEQIEQGVGDIMQYGGDPVSMYGYSDNSPFRNRKKNLIKSPFISMGNTGKNLIGISDTGDIKYMPAYSGDYKFDGNQVMEIPYGQTNFKEIDQAIIDLDKSINAKIISKNQNRVDALNSQKNQLKKLKDTLLELKQARIVPEASNEEGGYLGKIVEGFQNTFVPSRFTSSSFSNRANLVLKDVIAANKAYNLINDENNKLSKLYDNYPTDTVRRSNKFKDLSIPINLITDLKDQIGRRFIGDYDLDYALMARQRGGSIKKILKKGLDNYTDYRNKVTGNPEYYAAPALSSSLNSNTKDIYQDPVYEDILEILDPTGISSYDDVYRAYNNYKSGKGSMTDLVLEGTGAIPVLGKFGKLTKGAKWLKNAATASDYVGDGLSILDLLSRQEGGFTYAQAGIANLKNELKNLLENKKNGINNLEQEKRIQELFSELKLTPKNLAGERRRERIIAQKEEMEFQKMLKEEQELNIKNNLAKGRQIRKDNLE